jgi:RNA polymerase sigma-70 factor (ECF subfamily)
MRFARRTTPRAGEDPAERSTDADLVRLAQLSPRAFEPLYLRYLDPVLAYCSYRLADRAEAEDAASAVFLKALHGLAGFRPQHGSFRSWLFRIAHNEVADRYKYRSRHPDEPLDGAYGSASPERSPEEQTVARDGHDRLISLLRSLPPRERAVLELRAADLATNEIAAVLGITAQNVRTAQCRAVARLRGLAAASGLIDREVGRG